MATPARIDLLRERNGRGLSHPPEPVSVCSMCGGAPPRSPSQAECEPCHAARTRVMRDLRRTRRLVPGESGASHLLRDVAQALAGDIEYRLAQAYLLGRADERRAQDEARATAGRST